MFRKLPAVGLSLLILAACSPAPVASVILKQVPVNSTAVEVTVPEGIKTSIFEMASELTPDYFKASEKENQIFSPLSLWAALGVLREGAAGETLSELDRMMKLPPGFDSSQVIPDLSDSLNFMEESRLAEDQSKNGILLTNGIFFDGKYAANIRPSFWERAADVWNTETRPVDFTEEQATKKIIREWVSDKTQTFIDDYEAAFATDGTAILNIYNVLYLKDNWLTPFHKTGDQPFHAPEGDVEVPFMGRLAQDAHYVDHEKARAAAFSGEKGIRVWFLLPKNDGTPVDLIPDLQSILTAGETHAVNFTAPLVDVDGDNLSLKDLLQSKGYTRLFNNADLSGMLEGVDAAVTEIRQKTKLKMDEKGFEAAAVTEIGVGLTSAPVGDPVEFFVDRPYLMVIEYQGLPLFIAQITDPSEK